jgi:hypothetical protein
MTDLMAFINFEEIIQNVKKLQNVSEAEKDLILKTCKEIALNQFESYNDYCMKKGFILRYAYAHKENFPIIIRIMHLLGAGI